MPDLPGGANVGNAFAVSHDGSVVVGEGRSDLGVQPTVWDSSGVPTGLVVPDAYPLGGSATVVSGDGRVVFGVWLTTNNATHTIFRSTPENPQQSLGQLGGVISGPPMPGPVAANFDGTVAVGARFANAPGIGQRGQAFRWVEGAGMGIVPPVPGYATFTSTYARDVSDDGGIVLCSMTGARVTPTSTPASEFDYLWDPVHGSRALSAVLLENGISSSVANQFHAYAISGDGSTLTGYFPFGSAALITGLNIPGPGVGMPLAIFGTIAFGRRRRGSLDAGAEKADLSIRPQSEPGRTVDH